MLIAGLGNPGAEYADTRHNIGFTAIDVLAERFKCVARQPRQRALVAPFTFKGQSHLLAKPQTYMNLSGESVAPLLAEEGLPTDCLLVIVDDINLPVGRVRLRNSGNDGGHNGLKSIIQFIGTGFWRLRIGVGQPISGEGTPTTSSGTKSLPGHDSLVSHVLGPITPAEKSILQDFLKELPELVALLLLGRGGQAMGRFNGRRFGVPPEEPSPTATP
jgi:peptidyl-tRNA hydrolase, PTH1 family